jgi:integrase
MSWINTKPQNSKDPKKKLYLFWYDKGSKNTRMKVTPFYNTREGKREANKLAKIMDADLAKNEFAITTGIKIEDSKLSAAYPKFISERLLKPSSEQVYFAAFKKFKDTIGDKKISSYTIADGISFIKKCEKEISDRSIYTYTKHLSIMWNWFIKKKYTKENIIRKTSLKKIPIETIPTEDLELIFNHFKENDKKYNTKHYFFIRFTYLTGFRPSTSLNIYGWNIKLNEKVILYPNIKGNRTSTFPIHSELEKLLLEFSSEISPDKKLFNHKSTDGLKFFPRAMKKLGLNYNLKSLRKTFGTLVANNISLLAAKIALDHENQRTTDDYYVNYMIMKLGEDIDNNIKFVG